MRLMVAHALLSRKCVYLMSAAVIGGRDAKNLQASDTANPPHPITVNATGGIHTCLSTLTIGIPFTRLERERRLDTSATSVRTSKPRCGRYVSGSSHALSKNHASIAAKGSTCGYADARADVVEPNGPQTAQPGDGQNPG
jgi:hypothetical protein